MKACFHVVRVTQVYLCDIIASEEQNESSLSFCPSDASISLRYNC